MHVRVLKLLLYFHIGDLKNEWVWDTVHTSHKFRIKMETTV